MSAFIDEHRARFGVEPICRTLDVSASAYYQRATGERSAREVADEQFAVQRFCPVRISACVLPAQALTEP